MRQNFGSLLSATFSSYRQQWQTFSCGIAAGICVLFIAAALIAITIFPLFASLPPSTDLPSNAEFTLLSQQAQQGNPHAKVVLQDKMNQLAVMEKVYIRIIPLLMLFGLVAMVVIIWMEVYAYVAIGHPHFSVTQAFVHSLRFFFPMIGLRIWVGLRSFVWIPLAIAVGSLPFLIVMSARQASPVGILTIFVLSILATVILAITFYPRFFLAPVILIHEKKSILQSAQESNKRSRGHWGKIVGNTIVIVLILNIGAWIVNSVFSFISPLAVLVASIPYHLISLTLLCIFFFHLTRTISEHQQKKAKTTAKKILNSKH